MSPESAITEESAESLISKVPDLSDEGLESLLESEQGRDKPRKTVVEAVTDEQKRRVDEAAAALEDPETGEPKLEVSELLANSRLLTGFGRPLLAGALHGETGTLTAAEAKKRAEEFANREVKPDDEESTA